MLLQFIRLLDNQLSRVLTKSCKQTQPGRASPNADYIIELRCSGQSCGIASSPNTQRFGTGGAYIGS